MAAANNTITDTKNNRRFALIVANSDYKEDPDLRKLVAPAQDAEALYSVLKDPEIGGFDDVKIIKNEPSYEVSKEIQTFLNERRPDDMLLLYFSCHGIKNEDGQLYFAATNTRRTIVDSTAISADFINRVMHRSRSRRQVLLLDCCYSGAFARGLVPRADKTIHTNEYFDQGRGRIVLTASDAMQYSFEENTLTVEVTNPGSIFTHAIVDGLKTGKADRNQDGHVSCDELYNYTYDHVVRDTPFQRPGKWVFGLEGDVIIAKNPYKKKEEVVEEEEAKTEQDPNDLIQDAVESLKRGHYNSTIEYSDKAITINPRFAFAYNVKGQALFNLKQYPQSLACYEKALELRPKYIEAINNKGMVLTAMGDYSKAIECFNQSIELNSNDASIWNYNGLAFHALEKYEEAINSFDRAISLNPSYTEALNNKASSSNQLNKLLSSKIKKDSNSNQTSASSYSSSPIGIHSRTDTILPSTTTTSTRIEEDIPSDTPKSKVTMSSINTPSTYNIPEQNRHLPTQEIKEPRRNNLKILIPVVAVVIGIVIAVVVIFGSGMMNQQPQPSTPTIPLPTTTNQQPTATDQSITTNQNTPIDITLAGSDPDQNDTLTAAIVTNPSHGTLSGINQETGVVTYTPSSGFTGDDSFTFKVNDGKTDSGNTGSANIRVGG